MIIQHISRKWTLQGNQQSLHDFTRQYIFKTYYTRKTIYGLRITVQNLFRLSFKLLAEKKDTNTNFAIFFRNENRDTEDDYGIQNLSVESEWEREKHKDHCKNDWLLCFNPEQQILPFNRLKKKLTNNANDEQNVHIYIPDDCVRMRKKEPMQQWKIKKIKLKKATK